MPAAQRLRRVALSLQLCLTSAGYSDMAVGLGRMLGFDFLRNLTYPYISRSITNSWRRWHISLGGLRFQEMCLSLGGNRVSKPPPVF